MRRIWNILGDRLIAALFIGIIGTSNALALDPSTQGYSETAEDIEKGEALFNMSCAACHNFRRSGAIGPGLARVTFQIEKSWLVDFIKDPQTMIDSGDLRAAEMVEEYKTVMPAFDLEDSEIESLLAYIYANKRMRRPRPPESTREGAIRDPIPEPVVHSGIGLVLEKLLSVPARKPRAPLAKINKLAGLLDGETHRIFVNDIFGYLYELVGDEAVLFLDIPARFPNFVTEPGLATGLTSFAFSPDFENDGILYTNHAETPKDKVSDFALPETDPPTFQYVITEWKTDKTRSKVLEGQGREILRFDLHGTAHCVQELAFNPTVKPGDSDYGLMYIGIGDAAASYRNRPELFDSNTLIWGKVLRIDPKGNNATNGQYGIPSSNPFAKVQSKDEHALPEIYAFGFRNPNTFAWDSNGNLFASDIGHANIEEVNWVELGGDYGWPAYEGSFEADLDARQNLVFPKPANGRMATDPLIQLDHDEIRAIAGGFICYDEDLPELNGSYLFGDIVGGRVFKADLRAIKKGSAVIPEELSLFVDDEEKTISELVNYRRADLRLGQDGLGGLYLMSKTDGSIWKVVGTRKLNDE